MRTSYNYMEIWALILLYLSCAGAHCHGEWAVELQGANGGQTLDSVSTQRHRELKDCINRRWRPSPGFTAAGCYILCPLGEAAQGAVQGPHSVPNTRVPALNSPLVVKQRRRHSGWGKNTKTKGNRRFVTDFVHLKQPWKIYNQKWKVMFLTDPTDRLENEK